MLKNLCFLGLVALSTTEYMVRGDSHDHDHGTDASDHDEHGDFHLHLIEYQTVPANYDVPGTDAPFEGISGLAHNNDFTDPVYYAVSDTVGNISYTKGVFTLNLDIAGDISDLDLDDTASIGFIELDEPDNYPLKWADTESIVYLADDSNNEYLVIATEGYREFETGSTNFFIFGIDGTYLGNLSFDESIFKEAGDHTNPTSGFQEGDGPEAMSTTEDHMYVVWVASNTLVQDTCDACVRISVNEMDYSSSPPSWTEVGQFRYDKDSADVTIPDITVVMNLSYIVVLESEEVSDGMYSSKAYHIDLQDALDNSATYDISECVELTDGECDNYDSAVEKALLSNFNTEMNSTIGNIDEIKIDAIAYGPGIGCADNQHELVAASDNGNDGTTPTYLLYLCFHVRQEGTTYGFDSDSHDHDHDDDSGANSFYGIGFMVSVVVVALKQLL